MDGPNVFTLLGIFVGLFFGNRLRLGSEAAGRRRNFRNCISCIMEEMRGVEEQELQRFYLASITKVTAESTNIREDIHWWNRHRFDVSWRAYCDTATKDFSKTDEWTACLAKTPGLEFDYRLVRDELLREIKLITKYAT